MGRIRFLEDQVAVRDGELATRDKEIAARDDEITELKKEAQLLKTRLAAAESLAKEANVRALAAGNGFDGPRTTDVTTEVDSSVPLNRISKVTGQLKALAERLDEMVEDTAG